LAGLFAVADVAIGAWRAVRDTHVGYTVAWIARVDCAGIAIVNHRIVAGLTRSNTVARLLAIAKVGVGTGGPGSKRRVNHPARGIARIRCTRVAVVHQRDASSHAGAAAVTCLISVAEIAIWARSSGGTRGMLRPNIGITDVIRTRVAISRVDYRALMNS
jgi:hypothetical protein